MAAPSAPVIRANQDGHMLYVRWQPVTDAATYNVYVQEASGFNEAAVLEATVAAAAVDANGWFFKIVGPACGVNTVTVTAVNAGAEESAASNSVQKNLRGGDALGLPRGKPHTCGY